jgi:hypothetical protein
MGRAWEQIQEGGHRGWEEEQVRVQGDRQGVRRSRGLGGRGVGRPWGACLLGLCVCMCVCVYMCVCVCRKHACVKQHGEVWGDKEWEECVCVCPNERHTSMTTLSRQGCRSRVVPYTTQATDTHTHSLGTQATTNCH